MQQDIEEQRGEWQLGSKLRDLQAPAKPAHRDLKRVWSAVGSERDDFAVEDQLTRRKRFHHLDDFGHNRCDVVEAASVNGDPIIAAMHLNASSVQLPLDSCWNAATQC